MHRSDRREALGYLTGQSVSHHSTVAEARGVHAVGIDVVVGLQLVEQVLDEADIVGSAVGNVAATHVSLNALGSLHLSAQPEDLRRVQGLARRPIWSGRARQR